MPGQRRLALIRARRVLDPDANCFVRATTGKLAIRAPRHRPNTVSVKSYHMNQQKQREKKWQKILLVRVPGQRRLQLQLVTRVHDPYFH